MAITAIPQGQTFSSENISKALLIVGIGVLTYISVSKVVKKVAKQIFEKNSSKPQLAAMITSSVVMLVVVMRALFWKSSKVQLYFFVIFLGYAAEKVAFYIWGKKSASSDGYLPGYMSDLVVAEVRNKENKSMIGREEAIANIATFIHGMRKTNAILLGHPGVGKTAIAKQFAYKIGKKLFTPHPFFTQMRLIQINIGTLFADLAWTETLEDRVAKIVKIGRKYPWIVYFIDRDDTVVNGARLDYHITLLMHLLPFSEKGEIRIIAPLAWEEYKLYFLPVEPLARLINIVGVKSPSPTKCFNMLRCRYLKFNQKGALKVSDQAIAAAVFFSASISSHQYPGKAIDLIEHTLSRVDLEKPIDEDAENDSAASIVIDVHQIVKSALAQYQWNDSPESLVQQYKQYINEHPNDFPGLRDGDSLWASQQGGPLLLT